MPPRIYFCTGVVFNSSSKYRKRSLSSKFELDLNSSQNRICIEDQKPYF
jgi:hypothetical protein